MKEKVMDMGAGLERLAWITQGTPTSYDVVFAPVLKRMKEASPVDYDQDLFLRYSRVAGTMNIDDFPNLSEARARIAKTLGVSASDLTEKLAPVEALYAVADHSRTLLFAIADGLLPSNVGGGYNLRVVFRRAQSFIERYGFKFDLVDVINWHIDHLRRCSRSSSSTEATSRRCSTSRPRVTHRRRSGCRRRSRASPAPRRSSAPTTW